MKKLTEKDIIKLYKTGVRDFSNIKAPLSDFSGIDLSRASFKNSDLKYSSFFKANLTNVDFSGTDLKWSDFSFSNVKGAKFTNANLSWSNLNNIQVDNTDFSFAQIQWCTIFNVDLDKCKIEKTNFSCTAFVEEEVTKEGIKITLETAEGLPIPAEVIVGIKENISRNLGLTEKIVDKAFELVSQTPIFGYRKGEEIGSLHAYSDRTTIDVYSSGSRTSLYIRNISIDEYIGSDSSIGSYRSTGRSSYRTRGRYG